MFDTSRAGRSSEIAAWSNAVASLGLGASVYLAARSWPLAVGLSILGFILLRGALVHRLTVWIAASFGTLAVAGVGGGLSWLFAHVLEVPAAPSIAAVIGALLAAILPAWAYGNLAQLRERRVRDSLIDPVSVPSSRG